MLAVGDQVETPGKRRDEDFDMLAVGDQVETPGKRRDEDFDNSRKEDEVERLFGRRTKDVAYRHQFLHTACVCFSMFALGLRNALIGPTFPDIRLIIDEDLSSASWIFTAKSFGGLVGAVCVGFAYDRYNKILVFICSIIGMGIVAAVTPWCYHFAAMLLVHVLHGGFAAALDAAATADVTVVWKQRAGPFMQAVHCAFSVGAIVSPLLCEPFLADQTSVHLDTSNLLNVTTSMSVITQPSYADWEIILINTTSRNHQNSQIYIPYSIVSLVCLTSVCLFFLIGFMYGNVYKSSLFGDAERNTDSTKRQYFLRRKLKVLFTCLLALTLLFYVVSEHCFVGFLMTFILIQLKWSKARGSTASSLFWVAFTTGRLTGIVIVKFVNSSVTIIVFMIMVTLGVILFLTAAVFNTNNLVWVSIVVIGYGMSVIFGSVFSWLSQNIWTLTGKMTSIFFTLMCIGNMGIPLLVGYLMDRISPMWFIYSCLVLIGSMCTCFIFTFAIFNWLKRVHVSSEADVSVNMK